MAGGAGIRTEWEFMGLVFHNGRCARPIRRWPEEVGACHPRIKGIPSPDFPVLFLIQGFVSQNWIKSKVE